MTIKKGPSLETIQKISAEIPTPYHLYDEKMLRGNARRLNAAFAWNPGFREYFAVKATPNPVLLRILQQEGCGVDCSSLTELMMAEQVGFSGDQIMFSSNATPAEDFEYARKLNAIINLDDITHISARAGNSLQTTVFSQSVHDFIHAQPLFQHKGYDICIHIAGTGGVGDSCLK